MSCLISRILQFKTAIAFGPISIKDSLNNDITKGCKYSWSSDGVCWTSWVDYNSYLAIAKNIEADFYLRILFTGNLGSVSINGMNTTCYSICLEQTNPFIEDKCNENLYNPYAGLDCALQLQQQLSDSIVCMFGIPIYYFRVLPNKDTGDYTFKEYVMHNVETVKQIQLIIPDGTMPSSKPTFSDMDFDWEVDWEVELGKNQFAKAFGDTAFPKQRDFIYIPMMKRMWEVNSAYDEKSEGLMWHSTTWKLGLVKWQEKTNVEQGDFDNLIDNLIVNTYDNVFAELENNEQTRLSATTQAQLPKYAATNLDNIYTEDYIRKQFSKNTIDILEEQVNNSSLVLAKNKYKFNTPANQNETSMITYQKGYCGEDGTLSFILDVDGTERELSTIISFGEICIKTNGKRVYFEDASASLSKIYTLSSTEYLATKYMIIAKWSRKTCVKEIFAYPYIEPMNIVKYRRRQEMYYFDFNAIEPESNDTIPNVKNYNNDFISSKQQIVSVTAEPYFITNIKLFNYYFDKENSNKESLKYTTNSKYCVINDIARPLDSGHGYSVR